jgi:hypothetical protein
MVTLPRIPIRAPRENESGENSTGLNVLMTPFMEDIAETISDVNRVPLFQVTRQEKLPNWDAMNYIGTVDWKKEPVEMPEGFPTTHMGRLVPEGMTHEDVGYTKICALPNMFDEELGVGVIPMQTEGDRLVGGRAQFGYQEEPDLERATVTVPLRVNGVDNIALMDSGAGISLVSGHFAQDLCDGGFADPPEPTAQKAITVDKQQISLNGEMVLFVDLGQGVMFYHRFYVMNDCPFDVLCGQGFMTQGRLSLHMKDHCLKHEDKENDEMLVFPMLPASSIPQHNRKLRSKFRHPKWTTVLALEANSKRTVRPGHSQMVRAKLLGAEAYTGMVAFTPFKFDCEGVFMTNSVDRVQKGGFVNVHIINKTSDLVRLEEHQVLGEAERVTTEQVRSSCEKLNYEAAEDLLLAFCQTQTDLDNFNIEKYTAKEIIATLRAAPPGRDALDMTIKFDLKACTLDEDQKERMRRLVDDKVAAFSQYKGDLGTAVGIQHAIPTGDSPPVVKRPYRIPYHLVEEVRRQLQDMLDHNVIVPSNSAWSAPTVMVKKADGTWRFCNDYRGLNEVTRKENYPLPLISTLVNALGQAKFFTVLDLCAGYWQIPMKASDQEKTAFVVPQGTYEYTVLPFGLHGGPGTFQRGMDLAMADLKEFVRVYVDDVIISSNSFEEHLVHVEKVLARLIKVNIRVKMSKCHFACEEVSYLGFRIGKGLVQPDPKKIEAITKFDTPVIKNKKTDEILADVNKVRTFSGMTVYHQKFIEGYTKIVKPLTDVLRMGADRTWPDKQRWIR